MNNSEKELYHQIHPLKLATDIGFAFISIYFFWQHQPILALALHIVPSIAVSYLLFIYADLEKYRDSGFGKYIKRYMSRFIEGARLFGDLVMVIGAWFHSPFYIAAGLLIIIGAWCNGLIISKLGNKQ